MPKNLLSVKQLDTERTNQILNNAKEVERIWDSLWRSKDFWSNKVMTCFFGEPSTRTRLSFERAMLWLGGKVITAADASSSSSMRKGESIRDTFYTLSQYCDVIVFRHPDQSWIDYADASSVPIINAGNGPDEHPTQALLDLYTIQKEFKRTKNLKVLFCGDLRNSRTIRSLIHLLNLYENNEIFFCPARCNNYNFQYDGEGNYIEIENIEDMDVVYMTRIQDERFGQIGEIEKPILTREIVKKMKPEARILHPLPRRDEIHIDVDFDENRAIYKDKQIRNGIYIRAAILKELLSNVQTQSI